MLLAATLLLYHTMLYLLISFITLIVFNAWIPWCSAPSINCHSHQNHQCTLVQSHFCHDAVTCSTYGSFNNCDLTFNNNRLAFILQLSRAITSHTADNITGSRNYYTAPIYSDYHFMLGHMTYYTFDTDSSVQCRFLCGHTTHYLSVMSGHMTRYTSVMPGHMTRCTSKSSVQRRFISARYMSVMSGHMTHYMSIMPGHMTRYMSIMPGHTTHYTSIMPGHTSCYTSESSVQCYFMPGHTTCYMSIQCCLISHHMTYYTSYTPVQCSLIPRNRKIVVLYLYSHVSPFWFWPIFAGLGCSSIMAQIKNFDIGFVGGGRSTRASYESLKPFIISIEHQIKNPENYSYIFDGHGSFDKAMQKIKASGEKYILCNVPLSVIADNLTTGQANEVAKEHNLHALSRKSLAEKQLAVKSHLCTKFCMQSFTLFKAVNKNLKSV